MFTLVKKAKIYNPELLGVKDVLVAFGRIAAIEDSIDIAGLKDVQVIDAEGLLMLPGFIDQHVHIAGGGGEGSFETRTSEITSEELYKNGITTVVGILGTDGITRTVSDLYVKACNLENSGLTAYIYTGSYQVPPISLTGDIQKDIVYIDKIVGIGEIAISDHRSYNPSVEELARLGSMARVAGMIGGKAGVVHLHMGDAEAGLEPIFKVLESTSIPPTQFVPSHTNRNKKLFEEAMLLLDMGGYIDLTAGFEPEEGFMECIPSYIALKTLVESGKQLDRVVISSDANGSFPSFDEKGNLLSLEVANCKTILEDIKRAVFDYNIDITTALKVVTANPARLLKLSHKGTIEEGKDADFLLTDEKLNIKRVHTKHFLI